MSATSSSDVSFIPQVWNQHVQAFFNEKLGLAQLAFIDKTLEGKPGETVKFPFFKLIGDVEEPLEDEGLQVDKLTDDAYSVTVKEVGKAVGWKDKALRKAAESKADFMAEAQRQMAQKFAKKIDDDLIVVINTPGNYAVGHTVVDANDKANVRTILAAKYAGFGDRADEAVAVAMHSQTLLNIMQDSTAGFLQANSLDPFWESPGFMGRLLGMAVFVNDRIPVDSVVSGKNVYPIFMFKPNPYGIFMAEEMNPEMDRDILMRETIVSATMWYGVLSLHGKLAAADKRITRSTFATDQASS